MKKKNIVLIATLALASGALMMMQTRNKKEESIVKVYIEGTSIIYDGPMAKDGVIKVKELYTTDIKRLIINSEGGEINIGMDLGEFVFDNGLDVEVKGMAFSSAANYVFPAGKNKYLHKDSMVGWHGGATQENKDVLMNLFMKKYIKDSIERETAYFKKIGVNQQSTVYGLRPEFSNFTEKQNYVGWTYSIEAMEKFNINNIILLDDEWFPHDEYKGKKIFTVTEIAE